MATGDTERYIAELQAAIAQARLQLDRDIYQNIQLPTYTNVTLPSSIAANTGMLPGDYVGGYGGKASAPFLDTNVNMMGRIGATVDPRLAALGYAAGDLTLAGQQQRQSEEQQRFTQDYMNRNFNASRSDADRAFAEAQRAQIEQQQADDFKMSLEAGVPVINGSPMPAWLQKHADWARQFQQGNQGRVPTFTDLVAQLGSIGRRPEDYNGGQPYAGTLPTAAPGVLQDPAHGGYVDAASGKQLTTQDVAALNRQRSASAAPITGWDPSGQPIYGSNLPGAAPQGDVAGVGGDVVGGGQMMTQTMAGGPVQTNGAGGLPTYAGPLPAYAGPGGVNLTGSGATAAIGAGTPMSQAQRELIERGRQADVQAQLQQNAQAIQNKQVEYQNAIATGNLELANRTQTELTALNNAKLALDKQNTEFQQGIASAGVTGLYNGQATMEANKLAGRVRTGTDANGQPIFSDTVEAGGLMGQFNGQSTLAGQEAYGGSGLVGSGVTLEAGKAIGQVGGVKTLEAQTAENQTAMQYLNLLSGLKGPENAFSYLKTLNSTPGGLRDLVDAAAGRYKMGQFGGGDASALAPASVEGLLGGTTSAAAGQSPTSFGSLPVYRGPASGQVVGAGQWAPQNIAKMDDYQRKVLLAQQEAGGEDPNAALAKFKQSLPTYGGPRRATVRMG